MEEKTCWICFLSSSDESSTESNSKWIHPCKCKGSTRWVHEECLLKWLKSHSGTSTSLFRYGVRRAPDSISIHPPISINNINLPTEEESLYPNTIVGKCISIATRTIRRIWPSSSRQVVTISSKLSCPQCKTPYIIVQKENSWILSFLEKINYAGSKTLTLFVYSSLVIGGLSILWVHGTLSLLFMYGVEDYTKLFSEIVFNEETLSEENILSTLAAVMNYFSFTLVAIPMIPLFLIASVLPITSIRHALSIILMGRLYMFTTNLQVSNLGIEDEFQPVVWAIPAIYVAYSISRDFLFRVLGISKKITERQLAATTDALSVEGDDENTIMAAVIIDSGSSSDESDANDGEIINNQEGQLNTTPQDVPSRNTDSPINSTVRTIATIRSSITPIISALFMPFLTPLTRMLFLSVFGRFLPVLSLPVIYKNLTTASLLILVKDVFQFTYHVERDHLEKSRSVLNYNLSGLISE